MRRFELANGWYGEALPDGSWACTMLDQGVKTSAGAIAIPDGDQLLFLRAWRGPETPLNVLGQSHLTGKLILASGASWSVLGPTCGTSPALFTSKGLIVENDGCREGVQGYRFIDESGRIWTGDETYSHPSGLVNEWTSLGGVLIGQGSSGGAVAIGPDGVARVIEPGDCRAIRVQFDGSTYAIAIVKKDERQTVFVWATREELLGLPAVTEPKPDLPPQPIDPIDLPKEPVVPDRPNRLATVQAVRSQFPTPLGARHAEFLITLASVLADDAGLLRKPVGGTVITLPDGTTVAQDIICYPEGVIFDVLGDGEGQAIPDWSGPNPVDPARYYKVAGPVAVPPTLPEPPHQPPPPVVSPDIEALQSKVDYLMLAVDHLSSKLAALEAKPEPEYEARCGRSFGHTHSIEVRKK